MKIQTRKIVIFSALLGVAFFAQGCGSSSATPSVITAGGTATTTTSSTCAYNAEGVEVCEPVGTVSGQSLYSACTSGTPTETADIALEGSGAGTFAASSAVAGTSPADGTAICQVTFTETISYYGGRYYLGPNAGSSQGGSTNIALQPWDQFAVYATGSYGASSCSNTITDNAPPNTAGSNEGDIYGQIPGVVAAFPIYGQVQSMNGAEGGYLYVGVNQGAGESGCFDLESLEVQIERCVDVNGAVHECPTTLSPSI